MDRPSYGIITLLFVRASCILVRNGPCTITGVANLSKKNDISKPSKAFQLEARGRGHRLPLITHSIASCYFALMLLRCAFPARVSSLPWGAHGDFQGLFRHTSHVLFARFESILSLHSAPKRGLYCGLVNVVSAAGFGVGGACLMTTPHPHFLEASGSSTLDWGIL